MEWIQSPLLYIAFAAYALLMLVLLFAFFGKKESESSKGASTQAPSPSRNPSSGSEARDVVIDDGGPSVSSRPDPSAFIEEAENLFSREKEPVIVTDEAYEVIYHNRATRKVLGGTMDDLNEPLHRVLGVESKALEKQLRGQDRPQTLSLSCKMPNGSDGSMQLRVAILNRMPRVYAFRIVGLEETRPSWVSHGKNGGESTSLTRGGHLDFREVDPASVELSADQMLVPLREMDDLLRRVKDVQETEGTPSGNPPLLSARNKLRRLIRHIEEIDWMLQVADGHLHQRPESFRAYEVLAHMAAAANRVSAKEGPQLKIDPSEAPVVETLLTGDRRVFEKVLTQLLTSAFRASAQDGEILAELRSKPLEAPTQSDDWYLFAGEEDRASQATLLTVRITFDRNEAGKGQSDLPAVVETLGAQVIDPRLNRRLDYVKKGRDSDLFGLTLARELVGQLDGELSFQTDPNGKSEFYLRLQFENASD